MTTKFTWMGGLVVAMMLAGFTAAHAQLTIGGEKSITYAKETLLKDAGNVQEATDKSDDTTYYKIARDHVIAGMAGLSGQRDDRYTVAYVLSGMVFADAAPSTIEPTTLAIAAGGAAGDNYVAYRLVTETEEIMATASVELRAKFAVSAKGGSITRTVTNTDLVIPGVPAVKSSEELTISGAVMIKPALVETVKQTAPAPEAKAAREFMAFGGTKEDPTLDAVIGTLMVGFTMHQIATEMDAVDELADITPTILAEAGTPHSNTATVAGDTSFAKMIGFAAVVDEVDPVCAAITDIRKPTDPPNGYTNEIIPQDLAPFIAEMALCVIADGETPIPEGSYTVTTAYKGLEMAAFPPAGRTHTIGSIERDGTTFRIPFITTNPTHKQRINILNRGTETSYSLGGLESIGDSVTALPDATGTLPEGHTVFMSMDLVEIVGASRAAGTLSIVADKATIDASIDIVNMDNGTIDTVYLTAE